MANLTRALPLRPHEPGRNPHEEETADELEERHLEEKAHQPDEDQSERDRAGRAPDLAEHALAPRQRADRERDDEGVVAGEDEVQERDPEEAHPELEIREDRHDAPGAGTTAPRSRRHQGVSTGSAKNRTATKVIAPAIGRVTKIASEPWDMMRL